MSKPHVGNNHFSTSSSVYSPLESEYKFNVRRSNEIIEEDDEEAESELFGSDYHEQISQSSSIHSGAIVPEYSTNTFGTFVTANGSNPSFTSINNSILRKEEIPQAFDADETPILDSRATYNNDKLDDKTPLVNASGFVEDPVFSGGFTPTFQETGYREDMTSQEEAAEPSESDLTSSQPSLTQKQLASKFQRLSVTLLQTGLNVTQESYQFQTNFLLNVQRANSTKNTKTRTSVYYKRIHTNPEKKDEDPSPNVSPAPGDRRSTASSLSDRSSVESSAPQRTVTPNVARTPARENPFSETDGGLNISFNTTDDFTSTPANLTLDSARLSVASSADFNEEDMSTLFIRALHPFDATESQTESDNSVCLSFESGDIAFVHTIDDSGWGEVTLLESLDRGWIPMNYFSMAVNSSAAVDDDESAQALQYSRYMTPLLHACGKFLLNPLSHTGKRGKKTFSVRVVNAVRDGVRSLLQETDCLSRSNEIVIKKPVVRKARKSLLSDWYNLMVKANEYKGTANFEKIEIMTLLIFQVIRRATNFFEVWANESSEIVKRETELKLQNDMNNYPLLPTAPLAKLRVTEINGILYSYLSMVIGRLDLIEHNPSGCDMLETVTHHIILLLRELLFISKTGSDYSLEKPAELDGSLDTLLSLVSELVTCVKSLVITTVGERDDSRRVKNNDNRDRDGQYLYTPEGESLIQVASKMIRAISTTITSIRMLFDVIGDFKLSAERSYPDYSRMRVEPEDFIRKCTVGMAKSHALGNKDLRTMKKNNTTKSSNRYSMIRSGQAGDLGITANGIDLLHRVMLVNTDDSAPFSLNNDAFQPFLSSGEKVENESYTIKDELLIDATGNLLGASFKGLVFTLTNEVSPPEYFFVSTFFICFRSFASGLDLTELLISRFDACNENVMEAHKADALLEVKLKNRRRLICKMFQIWLESYWNHSTDASLLATLMNFFNEGAFSFLPIETMKLIELAARLMSNDLTTKPSATTKQLITRNITLAKINRKNSILSGKSLEVSLTSRYSMVDGYELSRINTNSSVASSLKSMTLPLPLGVSGQTSSASSLLTKGQHLTIENVVLTYRAILGDIWCPPAYIDTKNFISLSVRSLLPKWYLLCEQSWVLSNYRPNLLDFNGLEIAKQLTLVESDIFCAVRPEELLNENFTAKKAHLKLAGNVRQSLLFTNCLSGYVLESVLQPTISQKLRVNIVKTWLKVAISCLYLRNFNSLAAIITSLQSHLITRLSKVWEDLSDKYTELYDYLSGIIHPEKNYSIYRTKLKSFLLSNEYNVPVVPYFSLFLQDLTFVTDGNPNYRKANTFLNQKLVNIDKYLKITRVIADIESLQIPYTKDGGVKPKTSNILFSMGQAKNSMEDYTITGSPALQELILLELWKISQLNKKEEDRAWKLSCLIQPRDTPHVNAYHDVE